MTHRGRPEPITPALLTYEQAEQYLTCGRTWLQAQVAARNIDTVLIGNRVRFTREALDAFVASCTKQARPARRSRAGIPSLAERKRSAGIA